MTVLLDTPVRGATVDIAPLIANRFSGRLIDVTVSSRTLANLAGLKRARRPGRGLEFEEVRGYVPGDDVRAIDWRVTARSGEAHTKLFHEDHEQPISVAVDLRSAMKFGSVNAFKSVLAAHAASLILWSGLLRGERVGAAVLHDHGVEEIPHKRSRNTVLHALGLLAEHGSSESSDSPSPSTTLQDLLEQLQRSCSPGGRVFIIGDFVDGLAEPAVQALRRLAKRVQLILIQVSDPLDRELPKDGLYSVTDGHQRISIDTADIRCRDDYQTDYQRSLDQLTKTCRHYRAPLLQISTDAALLPTLQMVFPAR